MVDFSFKDLVLLLNFGFTIHLLIELKAMQRSTHRVYIKNELPEAGSTPSMRTVTQDELEKASDIDFGNII